MILNVKIEKKIEIDLDKDEEVRDAIVEKLDDQKLENVGFEEVHDALMAALADEINTIDLELTEFDFTITEVKEEEEA